jgi:metal-responsive CopG/Arc/MetJ family transcriptional regulator
MKIKTSITLTKELLQEIDSRVESQQRSRSDFIEEAVRVFLAQSDRKALESREAALLRTHAVALNEEMANVLEYQVIPS